MVPHSWLAAFAIGYAAHLAADMLTRPLPLLWPLPVRMGASLVEVGSAAEHLLVFVPALGALVALVAGVAAW